MACGEGWLIRNLRSTVQRCLSYSNCLEVCIRVLARVVNAFSKGRNATYEEPDIESRICWRKLINVVSSFDVTERVKKLTELDPYLRNGVWYTSGRMRKKYVVLQILFNDQRLAELIMIQSHEENHEESAGTLARSRAYVWVVKGRSLARKVARSCPRCTKSSVCNRFSTVLIHARNL